MTDYFLKIEEKCDHENEVCVTAAFVRREYSKYSFTETNLLYVDFFFDDWNFSEVLRAEKVEEEQFHMLPDAKMYEHFEVECLDDLLLMLCNEMQTNKDWRTAECYEEMPYYFFVAV